MIFELQLQSKATRSVRWHALRLALRAQRKQCACCTAHASASSGDLGKARQDSLSTTQKLGTWRTKGRARGQLSRDFPECPEATRPQAWRKAPLTCRTLRNRSTPALVTGLSVRQTLLQMACSALCAKQRLLASAARNAAMLQRSCKPLRTSDWTGAAQ
jgi:hypothetical protein